MIVLVDDETPWSRLHIYSVENSKIQFEKQIQLE